MNRWWGDAVQGLWQWAHENPELHYGSRKVADATGTQFREGGNAPVRQPTAEYYEHPAFTLMKYRDIFGLHLSDHVPSALIGGPEDELWPSAPLRAELLTRAGSPRAVLLLDGYAGWYRTLHEVGATLPHRADGRNWRITVVVKPLGSLGSYRRSTVTGRWFSGRHRHHILGWAGDV